MMMNHSPVYQPHICHRHTRAQPHYMAAWIWFGKEIPPLFTSGMHRPPLPEIRRKLHLLFKNNKSPWFSIPNVKSRFGCYWEIRFGKVSKLRKIEIKRARFNCIITLLKPDITFFIFFFSFPFFVVLLLLSLGIRIPPRITEWLMASHYRTL